jgi:hypothetical protein
MVNYPEKEMLGFDAVFTNTEDAIFYLFQSDYKREEGSENLIIDKALNHFEELLTVPSNHPLSSFNKAVLDLLNSGYELRVVIISDSKYSDEARAYLSLRVSSLSVKDASSEIFDLRDLFAGYLEEIGPKGVTETVIFDFHGGLIVCDWLSPRSIVANLDVASFGKTIKDYIPAIFDVNVRNPLGVKNRVNRKIEKTLREEAEHFWHYNNGMTILCKGIREDLQNTKLEVTGPVIVNGCQTADTIARNLASLAQKPMYLLVRFIEIPEGAQDNDSLAMSIAEYTNSQTPVIAADFKSNHPVQISLQDQFKRLTVPWFYERKRGEWATLGDKEQENYANDGRSFRRARMIDIAQRWYAFSGQPAQAISGLSSLFEQEGTYSTIFPGNRSAEEYLVAYLLFDQFDSILSRKLVEAKAAKAAGDLDKAENRNSVKAKYYRLSRAKNLASAHLLALTQDLLIQKYKAFNYDIAKDLLPLIQDETLIETIFKLIEKPFLAFMDLRPEESMFSVLRDTSALKLIRQKVDEERTFLISNYDMDPIDRLPSIS